MSVLFEAECFRINDEKNLNQKVIFSIVYWVLITIYFMASANYALVGCFNSTKN